jgi:hypothetical protein
MKTILLAGYRPTRHENQPLGLQLFGEQRTLLQSRLDFLKTFMPEIVCVVAGACADEQLRRCPAISSVELAFDDTPEEDLCLTSNLKAGLDLTKPGEPCFVLPVEISPPSAQVWSYLKEGWRQHGIHSDISLVQAQTPEGAPWHYGFPLLLTAHGNRQLRDVIPRRLTDASVKYLQLVYHREANLAPEPNPL